jgi:hypothetical protein
MHPGLASDDDDGVIVGWVQPTGYTPFSVGCTHPTNGSPGPIISMRRSQSNIGTRRTNHHRETSKSRWDGSRVPLALVRQIVHLLTS